jgi:hypothetical protein
MKKSPKRRYKSRKRSRRRSSRKSRRKSPRRSRRKSPRRSRRRSSRKSRRRSSRKSRRRVNKRSLRCNSPVKSSRPEKKKMVLACSRGRQKLIHYGATGYGNNYSAAARRSFRARQKCSTARDKLTARYWACKDLWGGPGGDTRRSPPGVRRKY